jgi:hypothetical protein
MWALLAGRTPPARELVGTPELRLEAVLGDARFAILDTLLDDLLNTDPRVRLADWLVVVDELQAFQGVLSGVESSFKPGDLEESMRLAQRLGQLPSVQDFSRRCTSEQRMQDWATSHVVSHLQQEASSLGDELAALTNASIGAVGFQVSTGGINLRTLIELEPRLGFPDYDSDMMVLGNSGAFVLLTIMPITDLKFPALYLGLFLLHRAGEFWILRAPVLPHSPGGLPGPAINRYHEVLGPLPMMRQSSLGRSLEFCRETMELFRDMRRRYLFAVANDQDVYDGTVWRD